MYSITPRRAGKIKILLVIFHVNGQIHDFARKSNRKVKDKNKTKQNKTDTTVPAQDRSERSMRQLWILSRTEALQMHFHWAKDVQLERNELNISPFSVGLTNNLSVCLFVFALFCFLVWGHRRV